MGDFRSQLDVTLWKKHASGIGTARVWYLEGKLFYSYCISEHGQEVVNYEPVVTNNSGRGLLEQARLEHESRVRRYLQRGYKLSRDEAIASNGGNQIGLPLPMLAHPIDRVSTITGSLFVQRKYDGHRCLVARNGDEIVAYSRKGNLIPSIQHVIADLNRVMPDGMVLDGELYCDGVPLQTLSSWIKRNQPQSAKLKYHAYDQVSNEVFASRFRELEDFIVGMNSVELVATYPVERLDQAYEYFRVFRNEGFEGAMLRRSVLGYEAGKRSNQLIKIKERHDAEFPVMDVKAGKGDVAIFVLGLPNGGCFDCLAHGSVPEKQFIYATKEAHIGKLVTVEYAYLTADGVPFHCVAKGFREDV
jgi:ATP-dependent DNA ligase